LDLTKVIIQAADFIGLLFLDHVIFSEDAYCSLREKNNEGLWDDSKGENSIGGPEDKKVVNA
jgi:hypothetical protein